MQVRNERTESCSWQEWHKWLFGVRCEIYDRDVASCYQVVSGYYLDGCLSVDENTISVCHLPPRLTHLFWNVHRKLKLRKFSKSLYLGIFGVVQGHRRRYNRKARQQCLVWLEQKKLLQFTKLCKSNMSQHSKTVKMLLGRYYHLLNSKLVFTIRLAILNICKIPRYLKQNFVFVCLIDTE